MAKVIIFGCGMGADTAFRYLSRDTQHGICGFTVDAPFLTRETLHGLPVVDYASVTERFSPDEYHMFIPLGFQRMNRLRAQKYLDAKGKGYRFISYVHSEAYSLEPPMIGENCFILDHQIFNLDVRIGNNVTIWSGSHIGDRTIVGDHVWISSHVTISGDVTIGDRSFLGVNSSVSNHVRLGSGTFVGAQTLVSKDTEDGAVLVAPGATVVLLDSEKFLSMLHIM